MASGILACLGLDVTGSPNRFDANLAASLTDHARDGRSLTKSNYLGSGTYYRRLLRRDGLDRFAEVDLVIEIDLSNDSDLSIGSRRCIEPAAEPGFEYREFDVAFGECKQCDGRDLFEEGRPIFDLAVGEELFGGFPHVRRKLRERIFADIASVEFYAFSDRNKMRRRVEPGLDVRLTTYRIQKGAYRTFAVRSCDLDLEIILLRISEFPQKPADILQAELHRLDLVAEGQKIIDGFGEFHLVGSLKPDILILTNDNRIFPTDMKQSFIITAIFGLLVSLSPAAHAQTAKEAPVSSLLYKISGKDLAKPSYVFGTFHAVCQADMVPLEKLTSYLDLSDQLVLEVDLDDPTEMAAVTSGMLMPAGKTWKDLLKPSEFAKVDDMMKDLRGLSAEQVKTVKPTFVSLLALTSPKALGCTPDAYDLSLMKAAVAKKKDVVGMESMASQMQVLDSRPMDTQVKELYELALDTKKSISQMKELMAAYKKQDPDLLFELSISHLAVDKNFQALLLDNRNIAWIPKIETAISAKPSFVAVGAGHLGGKNGLISLLRSKGYDVTPVKL